MLLSEDEEDSAAEAEPRPDEVEAEAFLHIEHGERDEDGKGDDFLDDLELGERERAVADAVCGHLKHVFEQCYTPAHDRGEPPRFARHVFEVSVPGVRHETVCADEEKDGAVDDGDKGTDLSPLTENADSQNTFSFLSLRNGLKHWQIITNITFCQRY